ncbi:META domain-containing protein [Streptomyces sp. NBC_01506]|uniref:META domain-containing protein n=1 Tax=Streptomyces sp. NBC_01506 TaxID=2903887 RepID=UPI003862E06E
MRKQPVTTVTALAALALLTLAGCGTESGRGSDGAAEAGDAVRTDLPLTDVTWSIDSLSVDGKTTEAPAAASIEIESSGKARASSGCNSMGGHVTVDGDTITVGEKDTTLIGCPDEIRAFESALGDAFSGKLKAKIEDKKLTLTGAGGDSIVMTAEEVPPLVGTEWTVTGLVTGRTTSSLPKDAQGESGKATLTFAKDGTVSGSLGCNSFSATAKTTADSTITFGPLRSTKKLCPEPAMSVERKLMKALEGQTTYEVHHRSLTIRAADHNGFEAAPGTPAKP